MNWFDAVREAIMNHGRLEYPREACGVVVSGPDGVCYLRCRNTAEGTDSFKMHTDDIITAASYGTVMVIVHTHPNAGPEFSPQDKRSCKASGIPWLVVSIPDGSTTYMDPKATPPLPLLGRQFEYGVTDCYSIVQDYFQETHGVSLWRPDSDWAWWDKGIDLYTDHYEQAGFVKLESNEQVKPSDVILMCVRSSVPNHAAVFLAGDMILHHMPHRLSGRTQYGGYWKSVTHSVYRHRTLIT